MSQSIMAEGEELSGVLNAVLMISVAVITFHIGLARSTIHLLLKRKRLCGRGTNIFLLRQLSGALGSNSVMLGLLAFLLTFAVFGVNISFIQKAGKEEELNKNYPYDIIYTGETGFSSEIPVRQAEEIIEKYARIKSRYPYSLYTSGESVFWERTKWSDYEGMNDSFIKLSDFNALITPLGFEKVELADEYLVVSNIPSARTDSWDGLVYTHGGQDYTLQSVHDDYPRFSYQYFYIVVPDEVTSDMETEGNRIAYDLEDGKLDVEALKKELTYQGSDEWDEDEMSMEMCDYKFREYGRQEQNGTSAILVVGSLFAAVVFLFQAMAILALKTLSNLAEDRQRYAVLFRLGAGEREQSQTLFRQTFSFFLFPFAVPLLMSIPATIICQRMVEEFRMEALTQQIPVIASATAVVMTVVYLLYYVITYRVAKCTVVKRSA